MGDQYVNGDSAGILKMSIGNWHMAAIARGTHDIYGWGWNKYGQLGDRHKNAIVPSPVRLEELDSDDLVGESLPSHVSCGSRHTAILTSDERRIIVL